MKAIGIVAEYNPFHNGHAYQIEEARAKTKADFVVVVMSGSFVQRGEPAMADKWTRTKMALIGGADMVLELPYIYSCATAETFALGAIKLLNDTGIISQVVFGAEDDDLELLKKTADILIENPEEFSIDLKANLAMGLGFPAARSKAMANILGDTDILSKPNNILAIEYLKALRVLKSEMEPFIIQRKGSDYSSDEINGNIASASAIRKAFYEKRFAHGFSAMPKACGDVLGSAMGLGEAPCVYENLYLPLGYMTRLLGRCGISEIEGVSEGLENRIFEAILSSGSISEAVSRINTKRYTQTRIQRTLLNIILNTTKADFASFAPLNFQSYIRVLGFCRSSQYILSMLCKNAAAAVITNAAKDFGTLSKKQQELFQKEMTATDIYFMTYPLPPKATWGNDYTRALVIL